MSRNPTVTYNQEAVRKLFDEIADTEDALEKMHFLRNEIPREFIKRFLKPYDLALDAGGGTGINAILMAERCKEVTLVDISPQVLELATANIHAAGLDEKITIHQGDILELNQFADGAFCFVVCVGSVISHALEKNSQAVQELVRLAQPGSILMLGCDSKFGMLRHVSLR
jgi:ubiquinone/menaquinone biosynthesis C-methylase UbiE